MDAVSSERIDGAFAPRTASARKLQTLLKVSSSLASTMEMAEVLQIAIESACSLLELNTGAIYTLENETLFLGATIPPLPPHMPQELLIARLVDHPHIGHRGRSARCGRAPPWRGCRPAACCRIRSQKMAELLSRQEEFRLTTIHTTT